MAPETRLICSPMQLYSDRTYQPSGGQVHPSIELRRIPGKGRGLISSAEIGAGEIVCISSPLAFASGQPGLTLDPSSLVPHLLNPSQADKRRIHFLLDRDKAKQPLEDLLNVEEVNRKEESKKTLSQKGFGAQPLPEAVSPPEAPITSEDINSLLQSSSFGHVHTDLALSQTRGEPLSSFVGLWPELSLLNHSCAPNSVPVLVGDKIIVRSARQIRGGEEVTISYLGNERMMPASVRNKRLGQQDFNFECNCFRCQIERKQPGEITRQIDTIHEWLMDKSLIQTAKSALGAGDEERVNEIRQLCLVHEKNLMEKIAGLGVEEQLWLKSSVYGLFELLALCNDSAKSDPTIPASLSQLIAPVAPGSEPHLLLSLDRLLRAGEKARTGPETEAAAKDAIVAYGVRYGLIGDAVLTKIMDALAMVPESDLGRYSIPLS